MKKIFITIILSLTLLPAFSNAQTDTYKLLEPVPCIAGVGGCTPGTMQTEIDINSYILYIYKFSIAIAVFLAIVMIIWGGFLYITSETPFKIADGREKITNAVLGLVMVLVSYLILLTIDPRLVNIDTELPKIAPLTAEQMSALRAFDARVFDDLKSMNAETQRIVIDNTNKIEGLKKDKQDILGKVSRGEITPEEGVLQTAKLDQIINSSDIENKIIITQSYGISSYTTALDYIKSLQRKDSTAEDREVDLSNLNQYMLKSVANPTGNTPRPTDTPNIIQNRYNARINELLKTNTNADKIQILEKQRDFYIEQIGIDYGIKLMADNVAVVKAVTTIIPPGINGYFLKMAVNSTAKSALASLVKDYEKDLNDQTKIKASGISADQYEKIIQARINTINIALKS